MFAEEVAAHESVEQVLDGFMLRRFERCKTGRRLVVAPQSGQSGAGEDQEGTMSSNLVPQVQA